LVWPSVLFVGSVLSRICVDNPTVLSTSITRSERVQPSSDGPWRQLIGLNASDTPWEQPIGRYPGRACALNKRRGHVEKKK